MVYDKDGANPVFVVALVDQYGAPVTGVSDPAVYLSKSQAAGADLVQWVKDTDFTWHELTDGERFKGVYKLRQVDSPTVSAVDVEGMCGLSVHVGDHDSGAGVLVYRVEDRSSAGGLAGAIGGAVWDQAVSEHGESGSFGEEVHLVKAMLANKRVHQVATGVDQVMDNDGVTTLRTMTPADAGDSIEVNPS